MQATTLYAGEALSVYAYRCSAGPADKPFVEVVSPAARERAVLDVRSASGASVQGHDL